MKIYYMNDRKIPVTVQVNGQLRPSPTNPYGVPTIDYSTLKPQEGKLFDVDAPEGAIPWVKSWESCVLLTYVRPEELPSEAQQPLIESPNDEREVVEHEPQGRKP